MARIALRFLLALACCTLVTPLAASGGLFDDILAGAHDPKVTATLCGGATPAILDSHPSVPITGSRAACTNDTQCTGNGEFCDGSSGECRSSGLLERGDIYYVAGKELDIDLTVPDCTAVGDVLMGGQSLAGTGGFDGSGPEYHVLSSAPTTWQGQSAVHQVVGIALTNLGDGTSSPMEVRVVPVNGAGGSASTSFTIARVAAVKGLNHSTVSETQLRTRFLKGMYEKFGDGDRVLDKDQNQIAHGLDWSEMRYDPNYGHPRYVGTDLRIIGDQVVYAIHFVADAPGCDPDVYVDGAFKLLPHGSEVQIKWTKGPDIDVEAGGVCTLLSLGLYAIGEDVVVHVLGILDSHVEDVKGDIELRLGDKDQDGFIPVCDGCVVKDVTIGNSRIDVYTLLELDSVRVNVSATRYTDSTADPAHMGLALGQGMYTLVAGGGAYDSCIAADGTPASTCDKLALDPSGAFNWWGSDVPVPSPWFVGTSGATGYNGPRANAWQRLTTLGLTRHVAELPTAVFAAGSLIARRSASSPVAPTGRLRVPGDGSCMVPPDPRAGSIFHLAFGVNDVPVVGTQAPTQGELEATVVLAVDAVASQGYFGNRTRCDSAPTQTLGDTVRTDGSPPATLGSSGAGTRPARPTVLTVLPGLLAASAPALALYTGPIPAPALASVPEAPPKPCSTCTPTTILQGHQKIQIAGLGKRVEDAAFAFQLGDGTFEAIDVLGQRYHGTWSARNAKGSKLDLELAPEASAACESLLAASLEDLEGSLPALSGAARIELRNSDGGDVSAKIVVPFEVTVGGKLRNGNYVAKLAGPRAAGS